MINDLKMGLKMLRYAHGRSGAVIGSIVFVVCGIFLCVVGGGSQGAFFLIATAMWPMQLIYTLSVPSIAEASPLRRRLQTSIPVALNTACVFALFFVVLLIQGIRITLQPGQLPAINLELLMIMAEIVMLMVYVSLAYKYFVVALILFLLCNVFFNFSVVRSMMQGSAHYPEFLCHGVVSFVGLSLLGAAAIILGGCLQYAVSLLIYKKPLSRLALSANLRKYL